MELFEKLQLLESYSLSAPSKIMPKRKTTTTTPGAAPQVEGTKQITPKQPRVTRKSASAGKAKKEEEEEAVATGRSRRTEVRINYRDFSRTGSRSPLNRPATPHPKKANKAKRSVSPSKKTKAGKSDFVEGFDVHHEAQALSTNVIGWVVVGVAVVVVLVVWFRGMGDVEAWKWGSNAQS